MIIRSLTPHMLRCIMLSGGCLAMLIMQEVYSYLDLPHKCGSLRLWFASPVTRFPGGLGRPHQMDVDQDGNVYVASWEGGWMNKFVPKPGADPIKLVGRGLVLSE